MNTIKDMFTNIVCAFTGNLPSKKHLKVITSITAGYEEYLSKSQEYKDNTIKSMYKGTSFENESPEKLRQILRAQFAERTKTLN